ncbi:MAG TPA: alkaline phosphatase family protein [Stellaceae bacterium]
MIELPRRRFLQGGAALAGAALLDLRARPAGAAQGSLRDIDHFIILTKENRSFDHYFGTLAGVRGFDDGAALRLPGGRPVFDQDDAAAHRLVLPFHLDTRRTNAQRLQATDHSWRGQHAAWNGGRMDRWIDAHRAVDGAHAPMTMGYLSRADLPFYYALADAFTICDGYHASVLGPTHPNRYYLMTGTIDPDGRQGGPALDNTPRDFRWETYPERLERAGISWRIYHDIDDYYCNVVRFLASFKAAAPGSPLYRNGRLDRPFYEFLWDLQTGNIPQVSWVVPPSFASEHPDYLPAAGEDHTAQILAALWSNPKLWARTALILNYDENDGQFDHVVPPTPPPGTAGEYAGGLPVGLGFRVPCLVISPWSRGGFVCGDTFDHTSTLRLLETRFGVEVPNLSPWRRAVTGDLTAAFNFTLPPRADVPTLPETEKALLVAQHNAMALPPPQPPATPAMPRQEPGARPRTHAA